MAFAERFDTIIQAINNSELRITVEKLFDIIGVSGGDKRGSVSISADVVGDVTGNVNGTAGALWSSVDTTTVDGEDGTATVQLVFKDADGNTIDNPAAGTFYISEVATGLTRDPADTSIAVSTNGAIQNVDAAVHNGWHFVTTAAGLLGMTITAAADSYWVCFLHPEGGLVISDEITITGGA